jgi:hypothetical protein
MAMSAPLTVLRLFVTDAGASRFDTFEIPRALRSFAPPAAPLYASELKAASGFVVVRLPTGWIGQRHPTPKRQILFCLSGKIRITPDVGEPRILATGEAWQMEDTDGGGHTTEVISEGPCDAVIIELPAISN